MCVIQEIQNHRLELDYLEGLTPPSTFQLFLDVHNFFITLLLHVHLVPIYSCYLF